MLFCMCERNREAESMELAHSIAMERRLSDAVGRTELRMHRPLCRLVGSGFTSYVV